MTDQKEFDIKQGKLIKYLGNSENVAILEGVKRIGQCAFSYCENLTNIILGSNIKYIGIGTFRSCPKFNPSCPGRQLCRSKRKGKQPSFCGNMR